MINQVPHNPRAYILLLLLSRYNAMIAHCGRQESACGAFKSIVHQKARILSPAPFRKKSKELQYCQNDQVSRGSSTVLTAPQAAMLSDGRLWTGPGATHEFLIHACTNDFMR